MEEETIDIAEGISLIKIYILPRMLFFISDNIHFELMYQLKNGTMIHLNLCVR